VTNKASLVLERIPLGVVLMDRNKAGVFSLMGEKDLIVEEVLGGVELGGGENKFILGRVRDSQEGKE